MFKKIAFIVSLLIISNLTAQNTIQGTVKDLKTGEALFGVSLVIKNTNNGALTDFDGNFTLSKLPDTDFVLLLSYIGYGDKKVLIDATNRQSAIHITLHENVMELDEVILSTPFNKLQSENVVRVAYKSLAAMQKKGVVNLMDGISQIAGVTQMSTGSGISKPVIRGLTGSRVLVYNQGVRLENFQSGGKHGLGINESGIRSVEVIKGPASLLYGSDAIGGVVYLVPEKYANSGETKLNIRSQFASNSLGFNSTVGLKSSIDKWQFLARGSRTSHADYQIPNDLRVTNSRYNDKDLKAGIGYVGDKFSTDIRYNFNRAQNGIPHEIEEQSDSHKITGVQQKLDNHVLSAKNTFQLDNSSIKTNIGYTNHKRILLANDIQKIGMQLNTFNYDAKWHLPEWKSLESIIGVQGMSQTNTNFGVGRLLPDASTNSIGFFGTINYEWKKMVFQSGLRYDTRHIVTQDIGEASTPDFRPGFDKSLTSFTGSLGMKYELIDNLNLRLNVAGGFRAPNLSELASKGQHEGRIEIGNANMNNEKNWQTDLALEYGNTHFEFFANGFYNSIDNYIYLAPTGSMQNNMSVFQYNQDNAYLYGGEIGFHLHPHPWSWLHLESSFESVSGKQKENDEFLPLIPANNWNNQIRLTTKGNKLFDKLYWNLEANHTFKKVDVTDHEVARPAYTLVNTNIGADFKLSKLDVNLNLSVHNILNKEYISHLSLLAEHEVPNMGRNILLGLNLDF